MPFKKGESGNKSGRPKNAQNKETKKLREFLVMLAEDNEAKFKKELLKLTGSQFTQTYLSLLEYCTPKLNRTDITTDGDKISFETYVLPDGTKLKF